MAKEEAVKISRSLALQEVSLTEKQMVAIDSFQGIVDVLTDEEHHEHH